MSDEELRLECLKLASEDAQWIGGGDTVIDIARKYLNFVQGMVEIPSTAPAEQSHV